MTPARILFPLAAGLRVASWIACLIVVASFGLFALNQTSSASTHQQNELTGAETSTKPAHKGTVHKAIDEAAAELTSPFSEITAGSNSEWVVHGVGTLIALIVYGVGVGYLARVLRIRV
jgi:hypothetical protein